MRASSYDMISFNHEFEKIRIKGIKLFSSCSLSLALSEKSLFERNSNLATQTIMEHDIINCLHKDICSSIRFLLERYSPVNENLKKIIILMTISGRLELVGNQIVSICENALNLNSAQESREIRYIEPIFQSIFRYSNKIKKAFIEKNISILTNYRKITQIKNQAIYDLVLRLNYPSNQEGTDSLILAKLILICISLDDIWTTYCRISSDIKDFFNDLA